MNAKRLLFIPLVIISTFTLQIFAQASNLKERLDSIIADKTLITLPQVKREKVLDKTYFYPESQIFYQLHVNFLNRGWVDRPLLANRAFREGVNKFPLESISEIAKSVVSYKMDGFENLIGGQWQIDQSFTWTPLVEKANVPGFTHIMATSLSSGEDPVQKAKLMAPIIQREYESPNYGLRKNGKIIITTYAEGTASPEDWAVFILEIKKLVGDKCMFVVECEFGPDTSWTTYLSEFEKNSGKLPKDMVEKLQETLRAYLDVSDGIMYRFWVYDESNYRKSTPVDFIQNFIVPLFAGVTAEPKYKDKLLGFSPLLCYANHYITVALDADGTKTLRNSMDACLNANVDICQPFEWDEENENTSFQPTVARGFSTKRIMRYYVNKINNLKQTPIEGDNTSIPNLILSNRQFVKMGDRIDFELLNVPDGSYENQYKANLIIKNPAGKIIKTFTQGNLNGSELKDVTYSIPSEDVVNEVCLIPSIKIISSDGKQLIFDKGFKAVQIMPSYNNITVYASQPLRDIAILKTVLFAISKKNKIKNNQLSFDVNVKSDELIKSVEIMENADEVYSYDIKNEYADRNKRTIFGITYYTKTPPLTGKIAVNNADFIYSNGFSEWYHATQTSINGNEISVNIPWTGMSKIYNYLSIPDKDIAKGTLGFDFNQFKMQVPLKLVNENGGYAKAFDKAGFVTVERFDRQPDIPFNINKKEIKFNARVRHQYNTSAYYLRVITASGKIFRSNPIIIESASKGKLINMPVYSETHSKSVIRKIYSELVPKIKYNFKPDDGDFLTCNNGLPYYGYIGGGFWYSDPFDRAGFWPSNAVDAAPDWVMEDGNWCLKFDGVGNEITFPKGIFPSGAFTLAFEIKPTRLDNCVIFRHHGYYIGSVTISIIDGFLHWTYVDSKLKVIEGDGAKINLNKWNKIRIKYDLSTLTMDVNAKSRVFNLDGIPLYQTQSVFGGHGDGVIDDTFGAKPGLKFFKGYLRAFIVYPYAETD